MSVVQRNSLSPSAQWWINIQPCVETFSRLLQESPMLNFENAATIAHELKDLYGGIQQASCPDEADEIYTHLTHAIMNLFMCYQALAGFQWDKGDIFYGRAASDWIFAKGALHQEGMLQRAM
jgi:hypothetical protein